MGAAAEHREYDSNTNQEQITIPKNSYQEINFKFSEGEEFELLYTLSVKDNLPIDVWLVNQENFSRLALGGEFKYFIDGSGEYISQAKKIVSLTGHDNYKLIMTNYYANETVKLDIVYETRLYKSLSGETSSKKAAEKSTLFDDSNMLLYVFFSIVIIIVILFILFFVKTRKSKLKESLSNQSKKRNSKKSKRKHKEKSMRAKEAKRKDTNKKSSKKSKKRKSKEAKPDISDKISQKKSKTKDDSISLCFCGYCGKTVDTPFCKHCGQKV